MILQRFYFIFEDLLILSYIYFVSKGAKNLAFCRNAFRTDLLHFYGNETALVKSEYIRKVMSYYKNEYLEQITCLYHQDKLKHRLKWSKKFIAKQNFQRIIFGGVDYFEFALFCPQKGEDPFVDIIFHENYAIPYIEDINTSMFKELVKEKVWLNFKISQIRVYGPPAKRVLSLVSNANKLPIQEEISPRINLIRHILPIKQKINVMLYAYPSIEYYAPVNFTTLISRLDEIHDATINLKFKYKTKTIANSFSNVNIINDQDEAIIAIGKSHIGITFNSITFYELLNSEMLILVPNFLDAKLPQNLSQYHRGGGQILDTVKIINSFEELKSTIENFDSEQHKKSLHREKIQRRSIIEEKFYV